MKLSINGLSFSYEDKIIFDGLSLNLSSEKISVLIGQNGVGKSTLLRIIAGLETQSSGDVIIDGREVNKIRASDRDLAMVFQSYALYPLSLIHI